MSVITTLLPILWVRKLPVLMCLLPFDAKVVTLRVRPALLELNLLVPAYQQGPPDSYLHCLYLPAKPLGKNILATIW